MFTHKWYVDFTPKIQNTDEATPKQELLNVLFGKIHGILVSHPNLIALLPMLSTPGNKKRIVGLRIFAENKENVNKLVELINTNFLQDYFDPINIKEVNSYKGLLVCRRFRIPHDHKFLDLKKKKYEEASKKPFFNRKSKSNGHFIRVYFDVIEWGTESPKPHQGEVDSWGMSLKASPCILPDVK